MKAVVFLAVDFATFDLVVLPGGRLGTENLSCSGLVRETVKAFAEKKMVAVVCRTVHSCGTWNS